MRAAGILTLLGLSGCWQEVIEKPVITQKLRVIKVPVPCFNSDPPKAPMQWTEFCEDLAKNGFTDCYDIYKAAWADYGEHIEPWVRLEVLPMCQEANRMKGI